MPFITGAGILALTSWAAPERRGRDLDLDEVAGLGGVERRQVGGAQQEENVGRGDRRGLDANDDFVRAGFRRRNGDQREFEFAVAFDKGAKLQPAHSAPENNWRLLGRIRSGGRPRATLSGSDARTKRSCVRTVARAERNDRNGGNCD